jgi:hypothetical protein
MAVFTGNVLEGVFLGCSIHGSYENSKAFCHENHENKSSRWASIRFVVMQLLLATNPTQEQRSVMPKDPDGREWMLWPPDKAWHFFQVFFRVLWWVSWLIKH